LIALRLVIARKRRLPPHPVAKDAQLAALAATRPRSLDETPFVDETGASCDIVEAPSFLREIERWRDPS
jgi:ATP-dependent DNA helicase RecQ